MTRIKSAALTALGVVVALASLGFFATIGAMLIGVFTTLGLIGALAAGVSKLFGSKSDIDRAHT
jgi:hypothetical protein